LDIDVTPLAGVSGRCQRYIDRKLSIVVGLSTHKVSKITSLFILLDFCLAKSNYCDFWILCLTV